MRDYRSRSKNLGAGSEYCLRRTAYMAYILIKHTSGGILNEACRIIDYVIRTLVLKHIVHVIYHERRSSGRFEPCQLDRFTSKSDILEHWLKIGQAPLADPYRSSRCRAHIIAWMLTLVQRVVSMAVQEPLIAIIGATGTGKSDVRTQPIDREHNTVLNHLSWLSNLQLVSMERSSMPTPYKCTRVYRS